MKLISSGDFLYPFWIKVNKDKLFILFFGFIPVKSYLLKELEYPFKVNYVDSDLIDRIKYFSPLHCWQNKIRRPVYRINNLKNSSYFLLRMTDKQLFILRKIINFAKMK